MEKIRYSLLVLAALFLNACSENNQAPQATTQEIAPEVNAVRLEQIWEAQGLKNPESVVYDPSSGLVYVSNVNGSPLDKDGNGYITKLSLDGTIQNRHWVTGLDAPKGMAIHDDTLYASDIDTLVAIDIASGTIKNRYQIADAGFMNDVAADKHGNVYVSDFVLNRIYCLCDGQFSLWLESANLENPNGLHAEGDRLILAAWGVMKEDFTTDVPGHLKSISIKDKSISSLGGNPIGNLDGLESDNGDGYYVTDWMAGKLYHIDKQGNATLLLTLEQGMADLEVIPEKDLILLPMMKNDKVLAFKIK